MGSVYNILYAYIREPKKKKNRSNKSKPSILKFKNEVTLFVKYSYNSFYGLGFLKINRKLYAELWNFLFYMRVRYEHTINRYPRKWSCYFNNLPMVNNQFHWCLQLNFLVKSHSELSIILLWGKCFTTARVVS